MKILITGGVGTLGTAIIENKPEYEYTVLSRDPLKQLHHKKDFPNVNYVLGDIRDTEALERAFVGHDMVIHAAAQKHIPHGEFNVLETISVNITGSINVGLAAIKAGVKTVVGISTDKAAYPANVYGATKMLMESVFQELNNYGLTNFHLCRYGNVIGSNGSVVQMWKDMISRGENPKLTDPEMTRFWLQEIEAVELVFECTNYPPGTILIPKAPSCSMLDFADHHLGEVDLEIIGIRPGEKLHECLYTDLESQRIKDVGDFYLLYPSVGGAIKERGEAFTSDLRRVKYYG